MKKNHGFTLIELLTVVLILGILTSIALPQYRKSIQRAETANALINLKTIFDAAKRYKSTHSSWPTSFNGLDVDLFNITSEGNMGEFQYGFLNQFGGVASACRLANDSATGTYCLFAHYTLNGMRDVYTCQYFADKYSHLCDSMCTTPASTAEDHQCIID